jgi:hypothetical protein
MTAWKLKLWRNVGAAAALGLAACGPGGGADGEQGEAKEGDEAGASAPAPSPATATAPGGGEAGEAGAASAYAGLSGDQLTALRLQHLRGFVMAAARATDDNMPDEAGVLVQQGLLEAYDPAPDQFGTLNVAVIRGAADAAGLTRAQRMQRIRASEAEIERVLRTLDVDYAVLVVRLVDISTGLYQNVVQVDFVDPIEYQHSMGAAYAARSALTVGQDELRRENLRAFLEAQGELNRFVGLWAATTAPERPASYQQVLAQASRVRLALSPYL